MKRKDINRIGNWLPKAGGLMLGALLALPAAALNNFPCGTFVVSGAAKNENAKLYDAEDNVKILAVATNGTVLASSNITSPYGTAAARNFTLEVPLSTAASAQTARVGDTVNLVMCVDGIQNVATCPIAITQANGGTNLIVQIWDTVSYTNAQKAVAVLSRRYVEEIQSWVDDAGYGTYDPFADYDGDGRSNYREYLDGTSPFDATDYLRVLSYTVVSPALHAISFAYSGGRIYGVDSTTSLSNPAWMAKKVQISETAAAQENVAYEGSDEDVGRTTLYVVPAEGATSEFFSLGVK